MIGDEANLNIQRLLPWYGKNKKWHIAVNYLELLFWINYIIIKKGCK